MKSFNVKKRSFRCWCVHSRRKGLDEWKAEDLTLFGGYSHNVDTASTWKYFSMFIFFSWWICFQSIVIIWDRYLVMMYSEWQPQDRLLCSVWPCLLWRRFGIYGNASVPSTDRWGMSHEHSIKCCSHRNLSKIVHVRSETSNRTFVSTQMKSCGNVESSRFYNPLWPV